MLSAIEIDREHDLAYIRLRPEVAGERRTVARSVRAAEDIVLDLDENGQLIGIELLNASTRLDLTTIGEGPGDIIVGVKEAAAILDVEKSNFVRDHASKPQFPKPVAELASGRFWLRLDVERYAREGAGSRRSRTPLFNVGDVVALRSDPKTVFPVIEVVPGGAECRYRVFQNNTRTTYYESQLERTAVPAEERTFVRLRELQAHLTAAQIQSPSTRNLFSLRSGRVDFVPYQYRPVLKLIRADRPRLLIADEVGVGKTIEAGLIIKESPARTDISSILIICPKALVAERKWFTEMKRFDEHFVSLDGALLRHCLKETDLEGEWPEQYAKAILPFSLFDSDLLFGRNGGRRPSRQGLLALDPPPRFDLVIVDEAHHIRNAETLLHQGVRYFCDHAQAVLLLSATPLQLGSNDLFTLLNVLRPDLIIDRISFDQMAEPNRYINAAVQRCRAADPDWNGEARALLSQAGTTAWGRVFLRGSPPFEGVMERLDDGPLTGEDRVALTRTIEDLYTFSPFTNRTRRRDIGEFTTRKPETVTVGFTEDQRQLHDDLLDVVSRILARFHGEQNVKFMMTTIRRQAASCLYGLAPLFTGILTGKLDRLESMEATDHEDDLDLAFLGQVRADIEELLAKARDLNPHDPKVEAFLRVLRDKSKRPSNKALVFSTFRHTLAYLETHVRAAGLRVATIHGDVPDEDRTSVRSRFALPKDDAEAIDVLLSSEVGCEGLDFQFCDLLVNYDLPWNPMRIEQRIGRIDRYGQQSQTVAIVNLITPGTVDADIYERCLVRIGIFEHAVGGSEEILGEITRELHDIADSFNLSDADRTRRLQQLADNGIRRIREEHDLEAQQGHLFGLDIPNRSWRDEIRAAETFWLSPAAIAVAVTTYLASRLGSDVEHLLGDKPLKTLRLSGEARHVLLDDYRRLARSIEPVARDWEKWLRGPQPTLAVTFDQETATRNPKAAYLSVSHPLVRQAARLLEITEPKYCAVSAATADVPPGLYHFAVYRWAKVGTKPDEALVVVATDPRLEGGLLGLLEHGGDMPAAVLPDDTVCEVLDARHHSLWTEGRAQHNAENQRLAHHRVQSLTVSHRARSKAIEDQIARATNSKIRLMKESELARANADFARRMAGLEEAANSGDILATPLLVDTRRNAAGSTMNNVIEEVRRDREDLARVLKRHTGIRKIVEELYPDTAHFIYELLQNAEDAGATAARFALTAAGLVFEHDGRPFDRHDIEAITDIGEGTKSSDSDKIGRFGVGFKAVFAYSETPHIWCPTFSFMINDLVLPTRIDSMRALGRRTRFHFPFDNAKKPPDSAYAEIKSGLNELAETTLLFLTSLRSIVWQVEGDTDGEVRRIEHGPHHFAVTRTSGHSSATSHFLKFDEHIKGLEKQRVAIAFALDFLPNIGRFDGSDPLAKQLRVAPATPGQVAVFFPAEKETSGLRFHLHAPFVPELSRASIKETPANDPLFEQLATLTSTALHRIRELGLLTAEFLAVLPNSQDQIRRRYQCIASAIVNEMNTAPLTPTHARSHAPAKSLLQGKASLKDLLSDGDLAVLPVAAEGRREWVIGIPLKNSNADRFLSGLAIKDWDVEDFVELLIAKLSEGIHIDSGRFVTGPNVDFTNWLATKPAEWHQKLYAALYAELGPAGDCDRLTGVRLVRLRNATYAVAKNCFFPTDDVQDDDVLPRVDADVYRSGRSRTQQEQARKFLEEIGVREVGEAEEVERILKSRYAKDKLRPQKQDLKRFVALVERDSTKVTLFADYFIFERRYAKWRRPRGVFLDEPLVETGLTAYYDAFGEQAGRVGLAENYTNSSVSVSRLVKFAEAVGAQTRLEISQIRCDGNPQYEYLRAVGGERYSSPINRDYTIVGLGALLVDPTLAIAKLIWRTLCSWPTYPNYLQATYRKNESRGSRQADSQLVYQLRNAAWVPQGGDRFVRPKDAVRDLLPEGFPFDAGAAWLKAIGFEQEVAKRSDEQRQKEVDAKHLGFADSASLERAKRFAALPPEEQERILVTHARGAAPIDLPEREPTNPQRRAERVGAKAADAPERRVDERIRSVSVGLEDVKQEAAQYLLQQYTNLDGDMICQVCKTKMPFKLDDGTEYFEKVELLPELTRRYYQNYVALCPNHAAMFQYANGSTGVLRKLFPDLIGNELQAVLAQREVGIYFTKTHVADLNEVIRVDSGERGNGTTDSVAACCLLIWREALPVPHRAPATDMASDGQDQRLAFAAR